MGVVELAVGRDDIGSEALCEVAAAAARGVGDLLREGFARRPAVSAKADFHDLVTDYDPRAEDVIRRHLSAAVPGSRIVGEERDAAGAGELTWYVDPIDGTSNFAGGVPFFCVSIGAAYRDELIAGVVYDPMRDELFTATPAGATLNGVPMRSRGAATDRDALLATDFPSHRGSDLALDGTTDSTVFGKMVRSFRTVRRLGSGALTLAYVAAGRLDVTVGIESKPWDVAGGALLVQVAGGVYRPLPPVSRPVWTASSYVACVADFDLARSCLAGLGGGRDE